VISAKNRLTRADAKFLLHIVAQVFPLIENIAILDKLASGAAYRERKKLRATCTIRPSSRISACAMA